jgi:hypothetical protein
MADRSKRQAVKVSRLPSVPSGFPVVATDLAGAISACADYAKTVQLERTKREDIRAQRDKAVAAINSHKEIVLKYFELRFKEREAALSKFFVQLDEGVKTGNNKILDIALHGIVEIIKDNPLSDFESFQKNMAKQGFMLEL